MRWTVALLAATQLLGQSRAKRLEVVPDAERSSFARSRKVAIVVGVGKFPARSGIGELKYPARDADMVDAELTRLGYTVIPLKDSEATRAAVRKSLRDVKDILEGRDATLVFYFTGHGWAPGGRNVLATFDAGADDLDGTGLSVDEVAKAVAATGAARRVLWIDACRNEPGKSTASRTFADFKRAEGTRILFSSRAGKVSFENDTLQQGVFTHYLVRALKGEAAGRDGLLTFRDIADYVTEGVENFGLRNGSLQSPFESGEAKGDFLLGGGIDPTPVAPPRNPTVRVNPADGLAYVWIGPGKFVMGCGPGVECDADESPSHPVQITKGYWLGESEVTQSAYKRVMGTNPSAFQGDDLPVDNLTWSAANAYCEKVGGRLPTEAEWEFAAGAVGQPDSVAWHADNSGGRTHAVKLKQANPQGLYDMLGNVWEWTMDRYGAYRPDALVDPPGPAVGSYRVLRGGAWNWKLAAMRVSERGFGQPQEAHDSQGCRCVWEPDAPAPKTTAEPGISSRTNPADGTLYVWIPPGRFTMGCSPGDPDCMGDEKPTREVEFANGFWMARTETTQSAYRMVMGASPSVARGDVLLPVDNVDWNAAQSYCGKVGGRLPTEAEWEYAARGGTPGARYGAVDEVAWHRGVSGGKSRPVGTKQANAYGLHDMLGNLMEWTADLAGSATGPNKALRGGSFVAAPNAARASFRNVHPPTYRSGWAGFRCVME
jgi:formylglycine-generating enzyme required for sulfatase activity